MNMLFSFSLAHVLELNSVILRCETCSTRASDYIWITRCRTIIQHTHTQTRTERKIEGSHSDDEILAKHNFLFLSHDLFAFIFSLFFLWTGWGNTTQRKIAPKENCRCVVAIYSSNRRHSAESIFVVIRIEWTKINSPNILISIARINSISYFAIVSHISFGSCVQNNLFFVFNIYFATNTMEKNDFFCLKTIYILYISK